MTRSESCACSAHRTGASLIASGRVPATARIRFRDERPDPPIGRYDFINKIARQSDRPASPDDRSVSGPRHVCPTAVAAGMNAVVIAAPSTPSSAAGGIYPIRRVLGAKRCAGSSGIPHIVSKVTPIASAHAATAGQKAPRRPRAQAPTIKWREGRRRSRGRGRRRSGGATRRGYAADACRYPPRRDSDRAVRRRSGKRPETTRASETHRPN